MGPFRLQIDGRTFCDSYGREVFLRGINVSGDSKMPAVPEVWTITDEGFFSGNEVSFTGRPFPLEKAHEHFSRLKRLGFNTIRYLFTWEAIEHSGPGVYDEEYIEHTISVLRIAGEYGFFVFMDPHQDMWSRFTGGSGAPMWTLYACGLNPRGFEKTRAALVYNTYEGKDKLPPSSWVSNQGLLACATAFTLFFAGRTFAPKAVINNKNIQDFLQDHFLQACHYFACRIKQAGDLDNRVIVGWETLNEVNPGFIGIPDITVARQTSIIAYAPSPFQAMQLGMGHATSVPYWTFWAFGPTKENDRVVDPEGTIAWLPDDYHDSTYGWYRDPEWRLGLCIWAQHGVWNPLTREVVRTNYFSTDPKTGLTIDFDFFNRNYFLDFTRRYRETIRCVLPTTIIVLQGVPSELPPPIIGTMDEDARMVLGIHVYDLLTMSTRKWHPRFNFDAWGFKKANYNAWLFMLYLKFGRSSVRRALANQITSMMKDGLISMGERPCVVTETGVPFNLSRTYAYKTGDYSEQISALDACCRALEDSGVQGGILWCYTANNTHRYGDLWNMEDYSIYSQDDAVPYETSPRVYSTKGLRASQALLRPFPIAISGRILSFGFDLNEVSYTMKIDAIQNLDMIDAPTEIFLPMLHFPAKTSNVYISSGKWTIQVVNDGNAIIQTLHWWHNGGTQIISVHGVRHNLCSCCLVRRLTRCYQHTRFRNMISQSHSPR